MVRGIRRHLRNCLGFLAACLVACIEPASAEPLNVVASFSILADLTQRVGGDGVRVHALVGRDADAHVYQPTPADARKIAAARLVVVNGLGYEGWIERLVRSSGYRGRIATASDGVDTLARPQEHGGKREPQHESGDPRGGIDPHAWQDPRNVVRYVDNIAQALGEIDPESRRAYQENASRLKQEIAALDEEIRRTFDGIPADRRKVVTTHEAFGYFGRAYGIAFIAPIGLNTEAEPSAAGIGAIIRQIRRERIVAVFLENISDPRLLERIRQESGARAGGTLYSDSLSRPDGPAPSYLDMMRHNARTLAAAIADQRPATDGP